MIPDILMRMDSVLPIILLVVAIQIIVAIVCFFTKRILSPVPIIEHILRPFAVLLSDKLMREDRTDYALAIRGMISAGFLFGGALAIKILIGVGGTVISQYMIGHDVELFLHFFVLLSPVFGFVSAYFVSSQAKQGGLFKVVSRGLNENMVTYDVYGLRRAMVRLGRLQYIEWFIAPVLFYILCGVECAYLYVALSIFIRVTGNLGVTPAFQSLFRLIYGAIQYVVDFIGALFIAVASFFAFGARPLQGIKAIAILSAKNMDAVLAYSQSITLGGAYQNRLGQGGKMPWVGLEGATAKLTNKDTMRVMMHYIVAIVLFILVMMMFHHWA